MLKRKIRPGVWYLLITAVLLIILIYSPILTLREIRASGMTYLTHEDIVRICNVPYGAPLFSIETDEISKRLLSDLRIEDAVVRRSLPSYLDISVTERMPTATASFGNHYFAIDKRGVVIDAYNAPKFGQIPNINGIYLKDVFIGDEIGDENLKLILSFLDKINPACLSEIQEIGFDGEKFAGQTVTGIGIRLGDLSNIETKARLTESFLADLKLNPIPVEYADFKYDAPFIKMKEETINEDN